MKYKLSTFDHIGKRDYMQDVLKHDKDIFVVCDGLGWHDGSGKAAEIAARSIVECKDDLDAGFVLADHRIIEFHDNMYGEPSSPYRPHASTTAVALKLIENHKFEWMSVGDSFIIRVNEYKIDVINPLDEASNGGLTDFLGIRTSSVFGHNQKYHNGILDVNTGDVIILCSDGCEKFMRESVKYAHLHHDSENTFADIMGNFILDQQDHYQDNIAIIALQF